MAFQENKLFLSLVVAIGASETEPTPETSATYDPLFDVFGSGRQRFTVVEFDDVVAFGQETLKTFDAANDDVCAKALKGYLQRVMDDNTASRNTKGDEATSPITAVPVPEVVKGAKKSDLKAGARETSRPTTASPSKDASKRNNKLRDRKSARSGPKNSAIADEPTDGPECYIFFRKIRPETIKLLVRDTHCKIDSLLVLDGLPASMGGIPKPVPTPITTSKHPLLNEVLQRALSPESTPQWSDTAISRINIYDARDSTEAFDMVAHEIYSILEQRKAFENAFKVASIEIPRAKLSSKRYNVGNGVDLASAVSTLFNEVAPHDDVEVPADGDVSRRLHQFLADRVNRMSFAPPGVTVRSSDSNTIDLSGMSLSTKLQLSVKSLGWKEADEKLANLESEEHRKTLGVIGNSHMSLEKWRLEFGKMLSTPPSTLNWYCWTERLDEKEAAQALETARMNLAHSAVTPYYGNLLVSLSHSGQVGARVNRQAKEIYVPTKIGFGKYYQMFKDAKLDQILPVQSPIYQTGGFALRTKHVVNHFYSSDGIHVSEPGTSEGTPLTDERKHVDWCGIHVRLSNIPSSKLNVVVGTTNIALSMENGSMAATASTSDGKSIVVRPGAAISHSAPVNDQPNDKLSLAVQDKAPGEVRRTYSMDGSVTCIWNDESSTTYLPSGAMVMTSSTNTSIHTSFTGQQSRIEPEGSITSLYKLRVMTESHRDLHTSRVITTREDLVSTVFEGRKVTVQFADGTIIESSYDFDLVDVQKRVFQSEEWPQPRDVCVKHADYGTVMVSQTDGVMSVTLRENLVISAVGTGQITLQQGDVSLLANSDSTASIRVDRYPSASCEINCSQGTIQVVDSDGTTMYLPSSNELRPDFTSATPSVSLLDACAAGTLSHTLLQQSHTVQSRLLNAPQLFLLFDNFTAIELLRDEDAIKVIKEAYDNPNLEICEEDLKDDTGAVAINISSYTADNKLEYTRQLVRYPTNPREHGAHSDVIVKPCASHIPNNTLKKRMYRPVTDESVSPRRVATSMLMKPGIRQLLDEVKTIPNFFASPEGTGSSDGQQGNGLAPAATL
ncbi:hypothetical protein SeMB42_g02406 [Synchytrium endobioticum]|uniref:Uncharacterized protein n=1 Tax=Synchytrium endobioticum TaxID=286115 RepID=A0A507D9C8_9FUNG|nr:hypothetical protein SeLEV6574_g02218 [Synchytrium endobioticum]TPX50028.1 hypothetical protein SeMB42_g02406 [Synchytrium endobioticum]